MLKLSHAARSNDRDGNGIDDLSQQIEIVTGSGPVAINRGQKDLACTALLHFAGPVDDLEAGVVRTIGCHYAVLADHTLAVDRYHDALAAKAASCFGDEF